MFLLAQNNYDILKLLLISLPKLLAAWQSPYLYLLRGQTTKNSLVATCGATSRTKSKSAGKSLSFLADYTR